MTSFQKDVGNWVQLRSLPGIKQVDYHWFERDPHELTYDVATQAAKQHAVHAIAHAHHQGNNRYVLFPQWAIYFATIHKKRLNTGTQHLYRKEPMPWFQKKLSNQTDIVDSDAIHSQPMAFAQ